MNSRFAPPSCTVLIIAVFSIAAIPSLKAQLLPPHQHYLPSDYDGHPQNWQFIQDPRGVLYVANLLDNVGIMEFDGLMWKHIPTEKKRSVFSFDIDDRGVMYVGSRGDIGYLAADNRGVTRHISLADADLEVLLEYNQVHQTHVLGDDVIYNDGKRLYVFERSSHSLKTIVETSSELGRSFKTGSTIWVQQRDAGLYRYENGTLIPATASGIFDSRQITVVLPYSETELLIGTASGELFLYNHTDTGNTENPIYFETKAKSLVEGQRLYGGIKLSNGSFALNTIQNGVVVISRFGEIEHVLNSEYGLRSNLVISLFEDRDGALWVSQNNGITRIDLHHPIYTALAGEGYTAGIEAIEMAGGMVFLGTQQGLYRLEEIPVLLDEFGPLIFDLLAIDNELLVAAGSRGGLRSLTNPGSGASPNIQNLTSLPIRNLAQIPHMQHTLVAASGEAGIMIFLKEQEHWQLIYHLPEAGDGFISLTVENPADNLAVIWSGMRAGGVLRMELNLLTFDTQWELYHSQNGLAEGIVLTFPGPDGVLFGTLDGFFTFNEGTFGRAVDFEKQVEITGDESARVVRMPSGAIWVFSPQKIRVCLEELSGLSCDFLPFRNVDLGPLYTIFEDTEGNAWLGGGEGLAVYHANREFHPRQFQTLIRRVTINHDSLLYSGGITPNQPIPELEFGPNQMRFDFAGVFYETPEKTAYTWFLDGFSTEWSPWSFENHATFTSLRENEYQIRVKARNAYLTESNEGAFAFIIIPPWYRAGWMYGIYLLLFTVFIMSIIRLRSDHLQKRNQKLEEVVRQRTSEILEQKNKIEQMAEKLKALDQMKSRFFANVSHELRTPITLMIGGLEQLIENEPELFAKPDANTRVSLSMRNARRLQQLTEEILDLTKIEATRLTLKARPIQISQLCRTILAPFHSFAESKNILLVFEPKSRAEVWLDASKFEKILSNLVTNAFKFTPEGGSINVSVNDLDNDQVVVSVNDTGQGIPPEDLPHIFERFYTKGTQPGYREGLGIGLALTRELVHLHGGAIHAESKPGGGSTFYCTFRKGHSHLRQDQLDVAATAKEDTHEYELNIHPELPEPVEHEFPLNEHEHPLQYRPEILLVEDNEDLQLHISDLLTPQYQVHITADGKQALQFLNSNRVDLILSDVMMPVMNGFELAECVRSQPRLYGMPFIFLTALASEHDKLTGLRLGVEDYLIKPFSKQELLVRIDNLIRASERRNAASEEPGDPISSTDEFLQTTKTFVEQHISDSGFGVSRLAALLHTSERTLQRKLQQATGYTPLNYIRYIRLHTARRLLEQRKVETVAEAARATGFDKTGHFSELFKKAFGKSPSDWL